MLTAWVTDQGQGMGITGPFRAGFVLALSALRVPVTAAPNDISHPLANQHYGQDLDAKSIGWVY
ncbi:hypothetical protein QVZ43_00240 [Marinobacter sp. chi1]|uniref:Uncharacterized protein n=1 Tax=Marinobacter suaedae TaxID=3057675 RepID=A0ABT8VVW9_9GAMM|nr:hypothetical protein [Marinobacter sp. chi1]MDO3720129.1 hypothetical protein [Marinobacter sp. chi1]